LLLYTLAPAVPTLLHVEVIQAQELMEECTSFIFFKIEDGLWVL
jgi:hypothetical protein